MTTTPSVVALLTETMADAGTIASRKMFGEYALYCGGKLVALVCDDRLFVKRTPPGEAFAGADVSLAPPYASAKPCLLIPEDRWDDREWLAHLIRRTADALPAPKPKAPRKKTTKRPRET